MWGLPSPQLPAPRPDPPTACLPQPVCLDARAYWRAVLPTGLLACLCLAQAFAYRLRRVIAAFYFPKVWPSWGGSLPTSPHTQSPPPTRPLACSALTVPTAGEETGPVLLQRAIEEESGFHQAQASCHPEEGATAEGSGKSWWGATPDLKSAGTQCRPQVPSPCPLPSSSSLRSRSGPLLL